MNDSIRQRARLTVSNPRALPWHVEQPTATLVFRGSRRQGIFYQTYVAPQMEPSGNYVFESEDSQKHIKLWISAYTKKVPRACWLSESRETIDFDEFTILVDGQEVRWWEEWWSLDSTSPAQKVDAPPPSRLTEPGGAGLGSEELYANAVKAGKIYNGGQQCDSFDGPCACGAWHKPSEADLRLKDNGLLALATPSRSLRLVKG